MNPYEPSNQPDDTHSSKPSLTPLVLPVLIGALITMCSVNGAVQSFPIGSIRWVIATSVFAVAATALLGVLVYVVVRRR
jgi:hypothetical protein